MEDVPPSSLGVREIATLRAVEMGGERWAAVGGVHQIPVARLDGSLYLCGLDAVGPDPAALLDHLGADTVVCLQTSAEIERRHLSYLDWMADPQPHEALRLPTDDYLVAADAPVESLVDAIVARMRGGDGVLVHCGAGWGRTGVIAVLVMCAMGATIEDALHDLRAARPPAGPQSPQQDLQVSRLAPRLKEVLTFD